MIIRKLSVNIWNGFEAYATTVSVKYSPNVAFGIDELIIKDNGDGINYDDLSETVLYWY